MCEELPENLMLFVENEMIELMFVYKNYKIIKRNVINIIDRLEMAVSNLGYRV